MSKPGWTHLPGQARGGPDDCPGGIRVRENGWSAFTAQIQRSSHTGALRMSRAEQREPCESRGSRPVERLGVKFPRATRQNRSLAGLTKRSPRPDTDASD